jgi:type I restriction enzyme R subunit
MDSFRFDEKCRSQLPALQVLVNLGYQYLTHTEALARQWRLPGQEEATTT